MPDRPTANRTRPSHSMPPQQYFQSYESPAGYRDDRDMARSVASAYTRLDGRTADIAVVNAGPMKGCLMAIATTATIKRDQMNHYPSGTDGVDVDGIAELLRETMQRLQPSHDAVSAAWSDATITMQQLRVLSILYHEGPTRVSDLARKLGVSTPTVTGIIDRLVKRDATHRMSDARDRRVVLNALTDQGRQIVERLLPNTDLVTTVAIERLTHDERTALAGSLQSLLRVMPDPTQESRLPTGN